ncbi:MAG: hypothetical protein AB1349_09015 [Elusimicrobiota bacterium]
MKNQNRKIKFSDRERIEITIGRCKFKGEIKPYGCFQNTRTETIKKYRIKIKIHGYEIKPKTPNKVKEHPE